MIRLLDILLSLLGILILFPLFSLIWVISFFNNGSPLFKQKRVGKYQKSFILIKFRTMPKNTKSVATHLIKNINLNYFSFFLRKNKLDEIPQLWNVLMGEMSLVGPRPCLFNQKKLIMERKKRGVFKVKPGITGLAQIKNIMMKNPTLLAKIDLQMIKQLNVFNYFYYIVVTILLIFKK
jgi:lipopolysaccharide/colanic/teichoic acid biosynthesis glycosyltransferase